MSSQSNLNIVSYDKRHPEVAQVANESRIYGVANQPRTDDPSMKQLLTWTVDDNDRSQFKTSNQIKLQYANEIEKYKLKINKSSSEFETEYNDEYRKRLLAQQANAGNSGKQEIIPIDLQVLQKLKGSSPNKKGEVLSDKQINPSNYHTNAADKPRTEYNTQFGLKDINNIDTLKRALAANAVQNGAHHIPESLYVYDDGRENDKPVDNEEVSEQEVEEQGEENDKPEIETYIKKKKKRVLKAKELDPVYEKERLKRRKDRIKNFQIASRELPNSAFSSYFGKVPFENYGHQNVKPAVGSIVYGNYLRTHNVNPHRGDNQPEFVQSYNNSLRIAQRNPVVEHQPPRVCQEEYRLSQNQVEEMKSRNQIMPSKAKQDVPLVLVQPNLEVSLRFASRENSPVASEESDKEENVPKSAINQKQGNATQQVVINQDGKEKTIQKEQKKKDKAPNSEEKDSTLGSSTYESLDPARQNFIDQLKEQKLHQNRLAKKVTEVVPDLDQARRQLERPKSALPGAHQTPAPQETKNNNVIPDVTLAQFNEFELNPQNYQNVPSNWLTRIPSAGQKQEKSEDVQSIFYGNN